YDFSGLRPGSYTLTETPPAGYLDGIDTPGSLGGTAARDQLFVTLGAGVHGTDYNFGHLLPLPDLTPHAVPEPVPAPAPDVPAPGVVSARAVVPPPAPAAPPDVVAVLAPLSKREFLGSNWLALMNS